MTENRERDKDKNQSKEKDKEKQKDSDRNVLLHLGRKIHERGGSTFSEEFRFCRCNAISVESLEDITIVLESSYFAEARNACAKDEHVGTQRVYKKTAVNSSMTLYLPTRELISHGTLPAILKGIISVDPQIVENNRVYAQLTLTFRYGREDEEVMGLRFCNEAIMSLHQVWPRIEDPPKESLSPLQDALMKRLGEGSYPFTLSLTPQAPPSVQLVPAKRYYGAPIGTSYDVRCFIADKADQKYHRRAMVKMGIRVIHRANISSGLGPENFTALMNNQVPSHLEHRMKSMLNEPIPTSMDSTSTSLAAATSPVKKLLTDTKSTPNVSSNSRVLKPEKGGDTFSKIRLSPKSFRFSSRFCRSKSEVDKVPNDPFVNYSKSFQEYESCGGPQCAVNKPFLLQEGKVGLRASLDKSWYTHGEDVIVTINIKNDSRKSVRRMRVCAIQHVDVCMFNNGKFKNVVADSEMNSPSGIDRIVGPGGNLDVNIILKPQRGPTKNWIALEDSLQRSSEPEEVTGVIAASAIRPSMQSVSLNPDDRNVFAIYVSYYVKVKLTLSGMGGELSLKLPFALVHIDPANHSEYLAKNDNEINEIVTSPDKIKLPLEDEHPLHCDPPLSPKNTITTITNQSSNNIVNKIDSIENCTELKQNKTNMHGKRRLTRHETIARDLSSDEEEPIENGSDNGNISEVPKHKLDEPHGNDADQPSHQRTLVQVHSTLSQD